MVLTRASVCLPLSLSLSHTHTLSLSLSLSSALYPPSPSRSYRKAQIKSPEDRPHQVGYPQEIDILS